MKNRKIKVLRLVIVLLLAADMITIFLFSAQKAEQSDNTSTGFIQVLAEIFYPGFESLTAEKQQSVIQGLQFVVRKAAHMTEFASLGVLLCAFAFTFGEKFKCFLFSYLFGVFYAATDEIHQLFVEGRSCQFSDVLIDSCGVLIGMTVFYFVVKIILAIKRKHSKTA
ncbi:MAG: VanZ family protein [Acutalibacteraceae bacterium]